jgi:mercuric ion transport protein
MKARSATLWGSMAGGFLASACCIGPVVFALMGVPGAALAQRLEPLRPYLLVATYGLLAGGFYLTYRPGKGECLPGEACELPRINKAGKSVLWIAAVVVVLSTTFPWYAEYLPF